MSHRTQIREAVKQQLISHSTMAGSSVFSSRVKPVKEFPAIIVYLGEAKRYVDQEHDMSLFQRRISLIIEGAVFGPEDTIEGDLEQLAGQIEMAIEADRTLGNLVIETRWQSTDVDIIANAQQYVAGVRVEYEVQIYTNEYQPDGLGLGPDMPIPTQVWAGPDVVLGGYEAMLSDPSPKTDAEDFVTVPSGNVDVGPAWGGEYKP